MESKQKQVIRGVISAILSLILCGSATLVGMTATLWRPVSHEGFLRAAEESGYVEELSRTLKEEYTAIQDTSGIPAEVSDAFVDELLTRDQILFPVEQMFGQGKEEIDYEQYSAAVTARIEAYALSLREQGELSLDDTQWEELKEGFPVLVDHYVELTRDFVQMNGVYSLMGAALFFTARVIPYLFWASLALILITAVLLVLLWKKKVLFFGYLTGVTAGILLLIPSLYLTATRFLARLAIKPLYLKALLTVWAESVLSGWILVGSVCLAVGVLCGVLHLVIGHFDRKKAAERTWEV